MFVLDDPRGVWNDRDMEVNVKRVNERIHLVASNDSNLEVHIDGNDKVGGENGGFRPMQLVLAAIAGCSSFDLVLILEKQRQTLKDLRIRVTGDRADAIPSPFETIHLHFQLVGEIEEEKAKRAVGLAVDRYCSVGEMLKKSVRITHSFEITDS